MYYNKPRILIVDDDKSVINLISHTLKQEEMLVAAASLGRTGLLKAKANKFDLILLDINLPDMSGYEVCEYLKTHPATEDVPVIFLTVETNSKHIIKAFNAGAVDYLSKPFHPIELIKRVEIHLSFKVHQNFLREKSRESESEKENMALFISTLGHELRSPLNSIMGFTEILHNDNLSAGERKEYLKYMLESENKLFKLLNDVIDIAKIESGRLSVDIAEIQLFKEISDLADNYTKQLEGAGHSRKIQLEVEQALQKLKLKTDLMRLDQILRNLIDNAIKYAKAQNITLGYKQHGRNKVCIFVRDDGIGVEEDIRQRIFEYFERGSINKLAHKDGKGLGLAICRNLTYLLGGQIEYRPLEQGSSFEVILPIARAEAESPGPGDKDKKAAKSVMDWSDKVILVTEDVMVNFLFLSAALKKTGAQLLHAKDGFEAIEYVKNRHIDLILMDMVMPGMSGLETTREVRKIKPLVPIIAQTSFNSEESRREILRAGCNDVIVKPIKPRILLGLAEKFIE